MVPRATSGDCRPCGDYRALNNATIPDKYPVLHLQDFARALFGKAVSSKIDVRFIGHVLHGLPFVYACIDDLLVANQNVEKHKANLALVLDRLGKFGVIINPSKCVLGVLRSNSSAIMSTLKFLPNCADLMPSLINMLFGLRGPLELTGEALTPFERIKNSLANATLLTHPAPEAQPSLMPLESPYEGPFRVFASNTKACRIIRGDEDVVSVNRVKTAVTEESPDLPQGQGCSDLLPRDPPPSQPSSTPLSPTASDPNSSNATGIRTARSGRRVQFSDRLITQV
ncbi:hypothetical protein SprV_0301232700 [Sparganum proliferum]